LSITTSEKNDKKKLKKEQKHENDSSPLQYKQNKKNKDRTGAEDIRHFENVFQKCIQKNQKKNP